MIAAIVPQFFTADLKRTLASYDEQFGFETQFEFGEPSFYAGAIRDGQSIFFRLVDEPPALPVNKYDDELLDAYIRVENITALHAELSDRGAAFVRNYEAMPWGFTEFVVKDCDGRLLCFGQATELVEGTGSQGG